MEVDLISRRWLKYIYFLVQFVSPGLKCCYCIVEYLFRTCVNPLNAELNLICHLLALLGGATIVVVSRLRVNTE